MSDAPDRDDKTEDASEKKKADALEKGQAPVSRETISAAGLAGVWISLALVAPRMIGEARTGLGGLLESSTSIRLAGAEDAASLLWLALLVGAPITLAMAACPSIASLLGATAQTRPRIVASRIAPQWSRISPAAGWSRLAGREAFKQHALTIAKLVVAIGALYFVGKAAVDPLLDLVARPGASLARSVLDLALGGLASLLAVGVVAAAIDLGLSRFSWLEKLRMTREEVKEEVKQAEGDPHVKRRIRAVRLQRARRRMIAAVPRATLVVANPTHYAIALRYVRGETAAPIVLAKGVDHMALTIRAIAEKSNVPVIEDRALARSMYDQTQVDQMIPAAFYPAVAQLVHMLGKAAAEQASPRIALTAGGAG